jgi:hypothetical protein
MTAYLRLGVHSAIIVAMLGLVALVALSRENTGVTLGTFSTGGVDLRIDSIGWYNGKPVPGATWALKNLSPTADKFFNYDDIKPGDFGCEIISMHVKKGEAWLCLDFKNFKSADNGQNEPESLVDSNGTSSAELADNLQFFGWIDNGDNKYKPGEKILFGTSTKAASTVLNNKTYAIGDSRNGTSCKKDQTKYVGMCWCAGVLNVDNTGKMTCDGSKLGNIAQTDSMTLDVAIRALSSTGNSNFRCNATSSQPVPKKPRVNYLDATNYYIKKGKSTTLFWSVENATTLSINHGVGIVTGTSTVVTPTSTRTYTLTATGPGGTDTDSATITVHN